MRLNRTVLGGLALAVSLSLSLTATDVKAQTKLRIQSAYPQSSLLWENGKYWAERVNTMAGGRLTIEMLPPGAVVPAFEILDAVSKRVLDGGHTAPAYWVGKNRAAALFGPAPGGPFGMDILDYLGWLYEGGGQQLYQELYQTVLKANVVPIPMTTASQQPLGWFKTPVKNWEDLKGRKCRHTGITAEVFGRAGVVSVNVPAGEIIPAGERGVIECAEYTGAADDYKVGFQTIWKNFYPASTHEPATVVEVLINGDVWKSLKPDLQAIIQAAAIEATIRSETTKNRLNVIAIKEMKEKHNVVVRPTPPDILRKTLEAWDEISKAEAAKNPFFNKVLTSQRDFASGVVPTRAITSTPYDYTANYYWGEQLKDFKPANQ
jgi:TRAP-type mannitol/chloroaromatic compound transport system substrate-binding protein